MLVIVIAAAGYAALLQLTGQPAAAEHFIEWAGGGIVALFIFGMFVGAFTK
jgi:hypothetical protein